jgi:phosphatidylglycerol:prolipoprotein diacylglycerol transferase
VAWIARPGKASFWNTQDLYLFALPFVLTIARVGCFLAHDHIGKRTGAWIGVRFPGGTRFDLGLLYAISAASTAAVALWANRKTPPAGVVSLIVPSRPNWGAKLFLSEPGPPIVGPPEAFCHLSGVC